MTREYPASVAIRPVSRPIDAQVTLPGSKSITNRALMLAAMAGGRSRLTGALFSDDTRYMADCLNRLEIPVTGDEAICEFVVEGRGGRIPVRSADLYVGNSGTTARFVTAFLACGEGTYRLDGNARMRDRPIEDLLDALRQMGVDAESENGTGCPPVLVRANGLRGGRIAVRGDVSSQYLTGLLMVAPLAGLETDIAVQGVLASRPYVDITIRMMDQWGVNVGNKGYERFVIPARQAYRAREYAIESDASGASYFFAAAAVTGGRVRVCGLSRQSLQGDVAFVDVLSSMGCAVSSADDGIEVLGGPLHGVDVDMNGISDTVMTLAAIAPFASSPTTIRNVANIRHKETDRIAAVAAELRRLGVTVHEFDDGLRIEPCEHLRPASVETYDDHRMAMSFAVAGLRSPGVTIQDPGCVAKTFPDFFERLDLLTGGVCAQA